MKIKVSVIVPVYNVEAYLDKCLNSLVNQTLKEIEIIIVNDGSKDNSEKIIKKYLKKYPQKIKYYKKENGGLSSARNYGLKYAVGEYVGFVDSDDYIDFKMYEKMVEFANLNNLEIAVSATEAIYEDHTKIIPASYNISENYKNYLISAPMAWNKIFKRYLFKDDFLFKEGIWYEDLELIPTLILKTKKISFLEEPLYKYMQRSGSIMNQETFNEKILDIYKVLNNIVEKFQKYKQYEDFQTEIEYLYIEHLLYSSALRLSMFKVEGKKYLKEFKNLMREKFPNWSKNVYFKKKSYKFKIICLLAYYRQRKLIYFLNKRR